MRNAPDYHDDRDEEHLTDDDRRDLMRGYLRALLCGRAAEWDDKTYDAAELEDIDPEDVCNCGGAIADRDHGPGCAGWAIVRAKKEALR